MGVSSFMKRYLSVYDFDGEEEPVEIKKEKSKKNPKKKAPRSTANTPLDKYHFLQIFSNGTKKEERSFNERLDVDDENDKAVKDRILASDGATQSSSSHDRPENYNAEEVLDEVTGQDHLDSPMPNILSDDEPVRVNLDDDNDIESSSQIPSDLAGPPGEQALGSGSSECDVEPIVVVYPEHVIYDKKHYQKPKMTFFSSSIKLDVSAVNGITDPLLLEWKTADIVKIESKWCERLKTANLNLHLKFEDKKVADDAKSSVRWLHSKVPRQFSLPCRTCVDKLKYRVSTRVWWGKLKSSSITCYICLVAGIVEIRFAVVDPHWSKTEEAIKLLDVRYIDKWDVDLNLSASFEDIVYPEGDPDSVSVSMRDVELLQPERFINDTIVDFYIKYLIKNKVERDDNHRFHFFNSFFFRKLADFDNNGSRACRGSEAFQRVRKWTKKMNIFQKDYIFVPVNFSLHWSLIIVCHPGEVADFSDEETEKSGKVPCILHMDSIKGSHRGLKNLIQSADALRCAPDTACGIFPWQLNRLEEARVLIEREIYLLEEWKARSTNPAEDVSSKFLNLRFVSLELPQQQNLFDCGLFLLHYMELFVEQAPLNFSTFGLSNAFRFLNKDWFPPAAASLKRGHIKRLIFEIAKHNPQKVPSSTFHGNCFSDITVRKEQVGEECLQETYNSNDTCQESSYSNALQSVNLTPVAAKPLNIGGPEFSGFGDQRFDEGLPVDENTHLSRNHFTNAMSPIEEGEETFELTACSPKDEECGLQLALITESSVKNIRTTDAHWSFDMLSDSDESDEENPLSRTNSGKYPISAQVHEKESHPLVLCGSSPENEAVIYECSSTSSGELEARVIEDSQEEENGQLDSSVSIISGCQRRLFDPCNRKYKSSNENIVPINHMPPAVPCVVEDSQEENDELDVRDIENHCPGPRGRLFDTCNQKENLSIEEPLSKRPRLMSPRTEIKMTRSLSKGIQEIVIL